MKLPAASKSFPCSVYATACLVYQQNQCAYNVHSGDLVPTILEDVQAAAQSHNHMGSYMLQTAGAASLLAAECTAEAKEQMSSQRRRLPEQARAFDDGFSLGCICTLKVQTACTKSIMQYGVPAKRACQSCLTTIW